MAADNLKKAFGRRIIEHESLKEHTTMGVGGVADYFIEVKNVDELSTAVEAAIADEMPYFVKGGGSNIIVSDYGYPGLVIENRSNNVAFIMDKAQAIVDSGVFLGQLINAAAAKELGGIEFLVGIPGTIGGAVYGNASCWGGVIGDFVRSVALLIPPKDGEEKCKVINVEPKRTEFAYRSSWLKQVVGKSPGRKPVILTVRMQLAHLRPEEIMRRIRQYQKMRNEKQPIGEFSVGSIFLNPSGEATSQLTESQNRELSVGYLLDRAGGKRLRVGKARVSKKHANFIIQSGKASAEDVKELVQKMKSLLKEKYGLELQEEVEFLGEWSNGAEIE